MFTKFNEAERKVHFPSDRRIVVGMKPRVIFIIVSIFFVTAGIAWVQYLVWGLPKDPYTTIVPYQRPEGFPWWLRLAHWTNFFFLVLIIRSGLSILMDHPRLYWNNDCLPGSEWLRFTPIKVPTDKPYTAKEDARYISPVIGLPGYRHTVGIARAWHFLNVPFFLLNGLVFVVLLFSTDQWKRIVPVSWSVLPDAWSIFVHYATFNTPVEPNGFYQYNALQQLSYFAVVFLFTPISIISGLAMSPAIENRFHWLPKIFGNRQGARSMHFLVMAGYILFVIVHVAMVSMTGLSRNMNHITIGTDSDSDTTGILIGTGILLFMIAFGFMAHWLSWKRPRLLQQADAGVNGSLWKMTINKLKPKKYYTQKDISSYFWANGKIPQSKEWLDLSGNNFEAYKLTVGGLVENPVELSLADMMKLAKEETITMHHCIQGWSGIAQWGGLPLKALVELVRPKKEVTTVVFYSFGEGLFGGRYYDTHTLDNCMKPASILAYEMNHQPLPLQYGAPVRLRIENQLGYKMVKWIERIEFVETHKTIGKGFGGKNEDDEYFDLIANS